ncbi:sugar phosphate nucleotidyltransferase [Neogemmobacter tilapiae]|nr:sugar phosphate nucleotidyltransferase [Gemmobacter tilapiae]
MNIAVQRQQSHVSMKGVTAVLLAGGQGTRLHELTKAEAKPAVFFGGNRRIIDFTLANAVQAGIENLIVATQYRPETLHAHIPAQWGRHFPSDGLILREGMATTARGYLGTADAVWANAAQLDALGTEQVIVLSGDHVYQMDYAAMIDAHRASGADVTLAATTVPMAEARGFGVIEADATGRVTGFVEKPLHPPTLADAPGRSLVNMGIYVFDWRWLRAVLATDAADPLSSHDFGKDILPVAVHSTQMQVWRSGAAGAEPYWRDVGTLDAYRTAQLDFQSGQPPFALPGLGAPSAHDALQFGFSLGIAGLSLRAPRHRPDAAHRWTLLENSVILPGARLGTGVRLSNVIVAPGTNVPAGLVVGEDPEEDARWFRRTEGGTTLITTQMIVRRAMSRPSRLPLSGLAPKFAPLRA